VGPWLRDKPDLAPRLVLLDFPPEADECHQGGCGHDSGHAQKYHPGAIGEVDSNEWWDRPQRLDLPGLRLVDVLVVVYVLVTGRNDAAGAGMGSFGMSQ
jgi:hypothetical protein